MKLSFFFFFCVKKMLSFFDLIKLMWVTIIIDSIIIIIDHRNFKYLVFDFFFDKVCRYLTTYLLIVYLVISIVLVTQF